MRDTYKIMMLVPSNVRNLQDNDVVFVLCKKLTR